MKDFLSKVFEKMKSQCDKCNKWFYMKYMISNPVQLYKNRNIWNVEYYCKKCYREILK